MPAVSSSLGTTQPYIPLVAADQMQRAAGFALHFVNKAALLAAVALERANITAAQAIWPNNQPFTVATEPVGMYRVWTRGASAVLSDANRVVIRPGLEYQQPLDANVVIATTGAPGTAPANDGDIAIDWDDNKYYEASGGSWFAIPIYVGGAAGVRAARESVVATRATNMSSYETTGTATAIQQMARTAHHALDDISSLKLLFQNWYGSAELTTGLGIVSVQATIEYPLGTVAARCNFSGSATGSVPIGGELISDATTVSIPRGALFAVRTWASSPAGFPSTKETVYPGGGYVVDAINTSLLNGTPGTATNLTGTPGAAAPAITSNNVESVFRPTAILGNTTLPVIAVVGDSLAIHVPGVGRESVDDMKGVSGIISRGIAENFAFINLSQEGQSMRLAATGTTFNKRLSLLTRYATHVICQLGVNDLILGRFPFEILSDLDLLIARHGLPTYQCTITPRSSSTDAFATVGNQTTNSINANRVTLNDSVRRSQLNRLAGYLEIADVVETARNSGIWKVGAAAGFYTTDGLHSTKAANIIVAESQAFRQLGRIV